ncbi:MAG: hypothetical protein KDC85_22000 [Saprospiraceae bacterium]|nr:hypothetical protein [Saprospiraceae bacterium]MCB9322874.1 hypothetical protein [Lewinellaceae bacterium]
MKVFWVILSMLTILNKFFFQVIGNISGIDFKVGSSEVGDAVSIFLVALAGLALVLDYFERNGKLSGTFLEVNKNVNRKVSGTNIHINQQINKEKSPSKDDQ